MLKWENTESIWGCKTFYGIVTEMLAFQSLFLFKYNCGKMMYAISMNLILHYNTVMFYMINRSIDNHLFDFIMPIITNLGNLTVWGLISGLILLFGNENLKKMAILSLAALVLSSFIVTILKYVIAEPRPFLVLNNVHLLTTETDYSFPSGHAAASFAAATVMGKKFSFTLKGRKYNLIYPLFLFAFLVGFSRIYNGVHYPLDVFCGGTIGVICALIVLKFEKKILNKFPVILI